ncbi:hypothetical protein [Rhizobium leguminosarum]|uniref:hypothetical protein n=1 Tax=Rhizobium leguminosarum TaxID=384 RepID=UPI003F96F3B7
MRRVSLNARLAQDAQATDEIYCALFYITHPSLAKPIRISTDNTVRLSTEPLMYGTRSTWMGTNPAIDPFLWVVASTLLPSDLDDAPAAGNIILENVDNEIAILLRSFTDLATIHMAVVLAASPNLIEAEWRGLNIVSADIDAGEVMIAFNREDIGDEYFPGGRMTRERFPGLHK